MGVGKRQQAVRAMRGQMWSPGRPSTARREDRVRFWEAIAAGTSSEEAAGVAGVSQAVGSRWFRQAGGMPPICLAPRGRMSRRCLCRHSHILAFPSSGPSGKARAVQSFYVKRGVGFACWRCVQTPVGARNPVVAGQAVLRYSSRVRHCGPLSRLGGAHLERRLRRVVAGRVNGGAGAQRRSGTQCGARGLSIGPHRGTSTTTAEFPAPTGSRMTRDCHVRFQESGRGGSLPPLTGSQDAAHHAWSAHTTAFSGTHTPLTRPDTVLGEPPD